MIITGMVALASCSATYNTLQNSTTVYHIAVKLPSYMDSDQLGEYFNGVYSPTTIMNPAYKTCQYAVIRNIKGDSALYAIRQELLQTGIPLQNMRITHE